MIKNINIMSLVVCGLFSCSVYAMENVMQSIKKAEDVIPFAGKVVAYKSTKYYFSNSDNYIFSDPSFNYGYIHDFVVRWDGGEGYQLHQLLPINGVASSTALITNILKDSNFCMRDVNAYEAQHIIDAMRSKKAKIAFFRENEGQEIISYLKLCLEKK